MSWSETKFSDHRSLGSFGTASCLVARSQPSPAHHQLLFPIDAEQPLVVDQLALAPEQHLQPAVRESSSAHYEPAGSGMRRIEYGSKKAETLGMQGILIMHSRTTKGHTLTWGKLLSAVRVRWESYFENFNPTCTPTAQRCASR